MDLFIILDNSHKILLKNKNKKTCLVIICSYTLHNNSTIKNYFALKSSKKLIFRKTSND